MGGCQIEATGLEYADSIKLLFKGFSAKMVKTTLLNEGKESVWQQWQKQKGVHKSTSLAWFPFCSDNSKAILLEFMAWISLQGMAVKTTIYTDNIIAAYFTKLDLFLIRNTTAKI